MIAATYCRKSTLEKPGTVQRADDEKSVAQQRQENVAVATRRGATIPPEFIFTDDGKSGALFATGQRPGFDALMAAGDAAQPPFQELYIWRVDRFSREDIDGAYYLKKLVKRGIRIIETKDGGLGRELDLTDPRYKIDNLLASEYRKRVSEDTRRALKQKVGRGYYVGCPPYGYQLTDALAGGLDAHGRPRRHGVVLEIVEYEGGVVGLIFCLKAARWSYLRIARALNRSAIPSPSGRQCWSPSTVRHILYNRVYLGEYTWGRTARCDQFGQPAPVRFRKRPADDWVTMKNERIVPDDLWKAAQAAITIEQDAVHRMGRPPLGSSPYLLSGLARCALCGATLVGWNRGRGAPPVYRCRTRHQQGRAACANGLSMRKEVMEAAVLDALERDLMRADVIEAAIEAAVEEALPRIQAGREQDGPRKTVEAEIEQVTAEGRRLSAAIRHGGDIPFLVEDLKACQARLDALRANLKALDAKAMATRPRIGRADLEARLRDWQALLRRRAQQGREFLRALLVEPITFTPRKDRAGRYYEFAGQGSVNPVVGLVLPPQMLRLG